MRVEALALLHKTNWEPAFGQVLVSTPGLLPATFFAGQTVDIIGVLQPPKGPVAEGLKNKPEHNSALPELSDMRNGLLKN